MSTSAQDEQAERKRVMRQDASVREQTGTYMSHTHDDALGRWREYGAAYVVGSKPDVASAYPAAGSAHQTELPPEPALGYRIDDLPFDPGPVSPARALPNPASEAAAPSYACDVEQRDAGLGLSHSDDPAGPQHFPPRPVRTSRDPGRRPHFRRRV